MQVHHGHDERGWEVSEMGHRDSLDSSHTGTPAHAAGDDRGEARRSELAHGPRDPDEPAVRDDPFATWDQRLRSGVERAGIALAPAAERVSPAPLVGAPPARQARLSVPSSAGRPAGPGRSW
jgi:hypothetical protein